MGRRGSRHNRRRNSDAHRTNHEIRADKIRLIDPDGEQLGVVSAKEGQMKAKDLGLDLVEVAPKARPPVCRIMDYGKYKYQQSKKEKKTDNVSLKTVRMRPKTDDHDLKTKMNRAQRFLEKGNQVKFVMQMRGRERKYTDRWIDLLEEMIHDLEEQMDRDLKMVNAPESAGWQINALVEPG
ncbi:translation initiation factor IF-3 [Persicimonas caeni]|uniref:Translation initiation factor IF-3 n=1 Tax=Persicimonas caeni TaxID=2292766 RepID=A0A4Y6PXV4_PERCE|nr:translation initiation factor IF-3 [Persicimonas caeni]QDG52827.1 translation initiation factor IF-3 [Persicimonas caeni]QED34049.1 translation initiation factor IF-3 [Persicimonas caeni]